MGDKAIVKEAITQLVYNKIEGALSEMIAGVNEKKFAKKLKKASELLAKDIARGIKEGKSEKLKNPKKNSGKKRDNPGKESAIKNNKKQKKFDTVKLPELKKTVFTNAQEMPDVDHNNA